MTKIVIQYTRSNADDQNVSGVILPLSEDRKEVWKTRLEIIALIVLMLTFGCNAWLAYMQSHANALNDRAFKYARLPWISVTSPAIADQGTSIRVGCTFENHTDSPVLEIIKTWDVEELANVPEQHSDELQHMSIMPHDQQPIICDMAGPSLSEIAPELLDGRKGMICHVTFTDMARDRLGMTFKLRYSNQAKAFLITDLEPTGDYTKL